jgi:hypothetical protein
MTTYTNHARDVVPVESPIMPRIANESNQNDMGTKIVKRAHVVPPTFSIAKKATSIHNDTKLGPIKHSLSKNLPMHNLFIFSRIAVFSSNQI